MDLIPVLGGKTVRLRVDFKINIMGDGIGVGDTHHSTLGGRLGGPGGQAYGEIRVFPEFMAGRWDRGFWGRAG